MADTTIRQGLRLLRASGFSGLNNSELVAWYLHFLEEIKRREGTYRISQDTIDGIQGSLWWDPCDDCDGVETASNADLADCITCSGWGIVNKECDDIQPFYSEVQSLGGECISFDRWDPTDGVTALKEAVKLLGGDIFTDPFNEGLPHPGFVLYVPILIREHLKEIQNQQKETSNASNSDIQKP